MTDTTAQPRPPLGVGDIIGSTFSIFFGRIGQILPLSLIPAVVLELLAYLIAGSTYYSDNPELNGGAAAALILLNMAGTSLATGFVIMAAYDARLGRPGNFGHYVGSVTRSLVTIVICSFMVGLVIGIAAMALIVPGLWLWGVWCVVIPAIVVERAGFGSFARSAELTRDYRWPCVGALVLVVICMLVLMLVVYFVTELAVGIAGMSPVAVGLVANAIANGFGLGLSGVCSAQIYARLREIKEGTSVEQIVEVFS